MFSVPSRCVPHTALSCRANSPPEPTLMQWDSPALKAKNGRDSSSTHSALALQPCSSFPFPLLSLLQNPKEQNQLYHSALRVANLVCLWYSQFPLQQCRTHTTGSQKRGYLIITKSQTSSVTIEFACHSTSPVVFAFLTVIS